MVISRIQSTSSNSVSPMVTPLWLLHNSGHKSLENLLSELPTPYKAVECRLPCMHPYCWMLQKCLQSRVELKIKHILTICTPKRNSYWRLWLSTNAVTGYAKRERCTWSHDKIKDLKMNYVMVTIIVIIIITFRINFPYIISFHPCH